MKFKNYYKREMFTINEESTGGIAQTQPQPTPREPPPGWAS